MSETVLVALPDGRALALPLDLFQEALERGRALVPVASPASVVSQPDEVLDATGMEAKTGVPKSWWLEAARRGDVPCLRAGKYVRFQVQVALQSLESRRGN